jgi:class 3 adenylate cyclase
MSVLGTGGSGPLGERNNISRNLELVDMGHDLLTPSSTIIAYTEMLLEYAEKEDSFDEFIPDLNKMLTAGEQLSTLITQLFSKDTSRHGEIDFEALTSTIRHDLRTPINAIIGYGEMLLEDIEEDVHPEASVDLKKILTSARRLLTLIGDLSYFSKNAKKSESPPPKKPEPAPKPTRLNETPSRVRAKPSLSPSVVKLPELKSSLLASSDNPYDMMVTEIDLDNKPASLLVVDDKESNRDLLSRRLNRQGFQVHAAEQGHQALQMIRSQDFDLVLLDIIMPEMNGYEVLAEIKADPEISHIPVIMISALDEIDSVVRCIEMGAEDYLQKPFNQVILNAKISASLERKRLRDRERAFLERLQIEQDKSEKLLLNILPKAIADRLKKGEHTIADSFPEVTVLFSDLVGFTELSTGITASDLVEKLDQIFLAFDKLTEKYDLEKIKTIGDAYMLVGGVPTPRADHAEVVTKMAIEMLEEIDALNKRNHENFKIRIGIHTGPVVAGVIGKKKFIYDLWGDTVNIASRMESQGLPNNIQVSEKTYERIKDKFVFEQRGPIEVKGKGEMVTYLVKELKS